MTVTFPQLHDPFRVAFRAWQVPHGMSMPAPGLWGVASTTRASGGLAWMHAWEDVEVTPASSPDPSHPGWEDVRAAAIKAAEVVELAICDLRAWPVDPDALRMAKLAAGVLTDLAAVASRIRFDEATVQLEVERQLASRRAHLRRAV